MIKNNRFSNKRSCYHLIAPLALLPSMLCLNPCEASISPKYYYIQLGAFKSQHSAQTLLQSLKKKNVEGRLLPTVIQGKLLYEVQAGPYLKKVLADSKKRQLGRGFLRSYPTHYAKQTSAESAQPVLVQEKKVKKSIVPAPSRLKTLMGPFLSIPFHPRVYGEGTWGQQTSFGDGDLLLPVMGNNDWIGFVDGAGKYGSDHAWFGSAGLGLRWAAEDYILGGYLFADYNQSPEGRKFWIANPGVEFLTTTWDATLNGYFPVSSETSSFGIYAGHLLGYNNSVHGKGHQLSEDFYNSLETVGPGADLEVGYRIRGSRFARPFIGSYFFVPKNASGFVGVEGGLELQWNPLFAVVVHDAYDKTQGNTVMGTLRVTLDKTTPDKANSLNHRLYDPFRRHRGAQQTGAGIPIVKTNQFVGTKNIYANAWFFTPGGSLFDPAAGLTNCTFENPCGEISQNALNGINILSANASLLLETGIYNNPLVGSGLQLLPGQSIYGRTAYFSMAAQGVNRPLVNDSLLLGGNNTIENLVIYGNTTIAGSQVGVEVAGAGFFSIENSDISSFVRNSTVNAVGIRNENHLANLNISNTLINVGAFNSTNKLASGVTALNAGALYFKNNTIQVTGVDSEGALGMSIDNTTAQIIDSTIIATSNHRKLNGLLTANNANVSINGSTIIATGENGDGQNASSSSYAIRNTGSQLTITNSSLTLNATNFINSALTALDQDLGGVVTIQDSNVNLNATNSGTYVSAVNINASTGNALRTKINLNLDNAGAPNFSYGVNGGSTSHLNLNDVDIHILSKNMPFGPVQGIQNSGSMVYGNTAVLVVASTPAIALTFSGNQPVNTGNVFCLAIQDGTPTIGGCP